LWRTRVSTGSITLPGAPSGTVKAIDSTIGQLASMPEAMSWPMAAVGPRAAIASW